MALHLLTCLHSLRGNAFTLLLPLLSTFAGVRLSFFSLFTQNEDQWLPRNLLGLQYLIGTAKAPSFVN